MSDMNISHVTGNYSVSPQIFPDEVAALAADGFVTVICNRPDNEDPGQPSAAEIAAECAKVGIAFHHIPISGMPIADELVQEQRRLIDESDSPVIGYCRSGQRSFVIWQASA
jgi:uncharacterized protein (TIGR01244 family)